MALSIVLSLFLSLSLSLLSLSLSLSLSSSLSLSLSLSLPPPSFSLSLSLSISHSLLLCLICALEDYVKMSRSLVILSDYLKSLYISELKSQYKINQFQVFFFPTKKRTVLSYFDLGFLALTLITVLFMLQSK